MFSSRYAFIIITFHLTFSFLLGIRHRLGITQLFQFINTIGNRKEDPLAVQTDYQSLKKATQCVAGERSLYRGVIYDG